MQKEETSTLLQSVFAAIVLLVWTVKNTSSKKVNSLACVNCGTRIIWRGTIRKEIGLKLWKNMSSGIVAEKKGINLLSLTM
jgi:hypothetical protein